MGCDIHCYVEKRDGSKWVSADRWEPCEYEPDSGRKTVPYGSRIYSGRNYDLFGILADVRNGRGFAGIRTGAGFNPISEPKGLPVDVSPEVKAESEGWGCDGHSHSWLTLSELLAYDWTQETEHQGDVDGVTFEKWARWNRAKGEAPEYWCGSCSGSSIIHISPEDMEARVKELNAELAGMKDVTFAQREELTKARLGDLHTIVTWRQPYYKAVRSFLSDTMPRLFRLGSPDNVRLVFWFDN